MRIGSDIADDEKVGVKRAGLMCLPQGVVRWGDVPAGTIVDQRETVQDVIEDAGVAVTPLGETGEATGARPHLRLRGVVRAASFRLCARHWGLGDAKLFTGDARVAIEWRAESRASEGVEAKHLSDVTLHLDEAHAATIGAMYRALLKDAARDLARWLREPGGTGPAPG